MNKLQKRALLKKRRARQKYLKYEAPLDRLESTLATLSSLRQACGATPTNSAAPECEKPAGHEGYHRGHIDGVGTFTFE